MAIGSTQREILFSKRERFVCAFTCAVVLSALVGCGARSGLSESDLAGVAGTGTESGDPVALESPTTGTDKEVSDAGAPVEPRVPACTADEQPERSCDGRDNDCNGFIDDVDIQADGFCDCLNVLVLGDRGYMTTSDFARFMSSRGATTQRVLLQGTDGVVDDALLQPFDVIILDRLERELDDSERGAVERFVRRGGGGLIAMIGYNFDGNDPGPEIARANSALSVFGLAYVGGYIASSPGDRPAFNDAHPVSMGIADVQYRGGIAMEDQARQGTSEIFATFRDVPVGLAHQTDDGGRIILWGDEWLSFDGDWAMFADVEPLWGRMLGWVGPRVKCDNVSP